MILWRLIVLLISKLSRTEAKQVSSHSEIDKDNSPKKDYQAKYTLPSNK